MWAAWWAGFDGGDRLQGLGIWTRERGIDLRVISYAGDWAINPLEPVADIPHQVIQINPAFQAGPWDMSRKHNYFIIDHNGARAVWDVMKQRH
jgi:hypothetical protein